MRREGLRRFLEILAGQSDDSLKDGLVVVSTGDEDEQTASAPFDSLTISSEDGLERLTVVARFAADQANFDWRVQEVQTAEGIVLDRVEGDLGRKAAGSVWTTAAEIDLIPDE